MGNLAGWHLIIILGIVVLLFGAAKLPALARSMGESMRIFKREVRTTRAEESDNGAASSEPGNADAIPGTMSTGSSAR